MTRFYFKEETQSLKTGMIILIHYQREGFQNGMTLQPSQPSPHCVRVSLAEKTNSPWTATQPSHPHYLKSFYIIDDIFLHLKRHLHHLYKNTNVSMLQIVDFFSFPWGMNEKPDVLRHTKKCMSFFSFIPQYLHFLRWTYSGPTRFIHPWTTLVHETLRVSDVIDECNSWLADLTLDWRHVIVQG